MTSTPDSWRSMRHWKQLRTSVLLLLLAIPLAASGQDKIVDDTGAAHTETNNAAVVLVIQDPRGLHRRRGISSPTYRGRQSYDKDPLLERTGQQLANRLDAKYLFQWPIKSQGLLCVVVEANDADALLDRAVKDDAVKMAQLFNTFDTLTAADPYANLQRFDPGKLSPKFNSRSGRNVSLMVVDTSVDAAHEDLNGAHLQQIDFVGSTRGYGTERHGTAVVGIIAAKASNGKGISGLAPEAELTVARACWQVNKDQSKAICNTLTLTTALDHAILNEVDLINLSLSGPKDPLLESLLDTLIARGTLVVAAYDPYRPADDRFPLWRASGGVMFAKGVQQKGSPVDDNGTAPHGEHQTPWEVSLPYSAITLLPNDQYDLVSGHSMAAPHLTSLLALLLEYMPGMSATELAAELASLELPQSIDTYQAR